MRKLLLAVAIAVTAALPLTAALADPPAGGPPGQEECEHGNSGQTCVPDPQPTHGQDCEEHGPNEGGVNEDHCLSETTTTTVPSSTTTSVPPTTTTTTTESPTTTTEVPPTSTTVTTTTTSTGGSTEPPTVAPTTTVQPPPTNGGPGGGGQSGNDNGSGPTIGKLAFTGVEDIVPWAVVALVLLTLGSGLFWLGNRKVKE